MGSPTVLLFMEEKNTVDHLQFSPKLKFQRPYTSKSMKTPNTLQKKVNGDDFII